ncbi:hypothetical protein EYB53_023710 [Candidatus Chloroploca sp. M-50]|uniref:L,D-transpeptidase n=1 Tax=Candidatus Chloroploca mongolica TaxID=2528176 RepID=A0ABS4DH24_9CHLR|nr:hypothetical protein [Candidatus Chloroploca mongolica]MBP1468742.1 hypothetical protein [Candidatus Chloroploca mongolica]
MRHGLAVAMGLLAVVLLVGLQAYAQTPPGTILSSGGSVVIPQSSAPVWDDRQRDDGALYDPSGRLIAYYIDAGQVVP